MQLQIVRKAIFRLKRYIGGKAVSLCGLYEVTLTDDCLGTHLVCTAQAVVASDSRESVQSLRYLGWQGCLQHGSF